MNFDARNACRTAAVLAAVALLMPPAGAQQQNKKGSASKSGAAANAPAPGAAYAERFASVCAACHGANGRSDMPGVPVLAGQPSFYVITALFLFREGRRSNEAMTAVAKGFNDTDLRGFSDYIGTLPPVPPPASKEPADAARMTRGQTLARDYKCVFCHGADLSGGQQVPRIAGQKEDYLLMSLKGYKTGGRVGYSPAMSEALSQVPVDDLDTLAYYVARFSK